MLNETKRLYCVEWHNTVFARNGQLSVHKLFTFCIRRCLVSRACDWVMSALSAALHCSGSVSKCAVYLLRQARRIVCPFVSLTYVDSRSGSDVIVTVSTSNATRFRFPMPLTQRPRVYSTVKQLVDAWPLAVVARCRHKDPNPAFVAVRKHAHK